MRIASNAWILCAGLVACGHADAGDGAAAASTDLHASTSGTTRDASGESSATTMVGEASTAGADTSTGAPEPEPLRVLFIGNSYTFVNDLPGTVERVADGADHPMTTAMVAVGGATLADHVANPQVSASLAQGWDVVVIQGQSVEPIAQHDVFVQAAVELSAMVAIDNPEARLLLYETWARRAGDPLYERFGLTPQQMQAGLTAGYADAARASMGAVAPVGQTWALALDQAPQIDLFAADGSHPSRAGTYLASCVFFRALTGADAAAIETAVDGVDDADADALEAIADQLGR
jgi:hypothetical protein